MIRRVRSQDIVAVEPLELVAEMVASLLRTIERGWGIAQSLPGVRPGRPEVELNERLRGGMRKAVGERWPKLLIPGGTETRSSPQQPRPDGVTDITIYLPTVFEQIQDHEPHAIIECKRVAGDDSRLCRAYVKQGIDRFVSGKYGRGHAADFMVGYLESGDADLAQAGINRRLTSQDRAGERLGPGAVLREPWVRTSSHPRLAASTPITLHHAFLAFRN